MKPLNINIFGGPGVGKSTLAAELFTKMKKQNLKVELVTEYAKDLTYGEDTIKLDDQIHILGEQHHRLVRLLPHVDYIIHESPFILGLAYTTSSTSIYEDFERFVTHLFKSYNNLNIFVQRSVPYQTYGRNQSCDEAEALDHRIKQLLVRNNIPFTEIYATSSLADTVLMVLEDHKLSTA